MTFNQLYSLVILKLAYFMHFAYLSAQHVRRHVRVTVSMATEGAQRLLGLFSCEEDVSVLILLRTRLPSANCRRQMAVFVRSA